MALNSTDILKEESKGSDILALKLAKKWYAVCMNTGKHNSSGIIKLLYKYYFWLI